MDGKSEAPKSISPSSFGDKQIIEITGKKKHKEIIEIEDSEEEPRIHTQKHRPIPPEGRKAKKVTIKCVLCKEAGKKASMRICVECRNYFHVACLQQQGELASRYRCRKCRHSHVDDVKDLQQKKRKETGGEVLISQKKLEKEKRREEQNRKLGQFKVRYPYYFQDDRLKFPIEDKLLLIYRELFEGNEGGKVIPVPHHVIPSNLLGDLLQLENFFSTFGNQLGAYGWSGHVDKSAVFLQLEIEGLDHAFSGCMHVLLKIYLSDIFDKNKTDNVKILNEHCFFTLLTNLHQNEDLKEEFVVRSAKEIMRYLATVPSMRKSFEATHFPEHFSLKAKLTLLVELIRGLSEVDEFHELVSVKSQRMQQLTKEKTELIAQLKIDQAQNLSNNEKLKDMAMTGKELELSQDGAVRTGNKELDKHKKRVLKLANQKQKSEETIRQIRSKISQIGRAMPFLTSQVLFLGVDRNNSQYFFYVQEPSRLYVKYHHYLLDMSGDFYVYDGKDSIIQLTKTLNSKGIHEKHLLQNLLSLIKDQIITNNSAPIKNSNIQIRGLKYIPITRQDIVKAVKQTQDKFTTYLSLKNYQWSSPTIRQTFLINLEVITELQQLKENIRSLQENFLFAELASLDGGRVGLDSEEEGNVPQKEIINLRKKIPIRIWGINSEKIKKYWIEYLEECVDLIGLWICSYVFKNHVDKYVKKKMESFYEQQIKEQKMNKLREKQRQKQRQKTRRQSRSRSRERQRDDKYKDDRYRQDRQERQERLQKLKEGRDWKQDRQGKDRQGRQGKEKREKQNRDVGRSARKESSEEDQSLQARRPNLRKRKNKKMNIVNIEIIQESDAQIQDQVEDFQDESDNEDCCQICGQYGEMICCDTCPKVYHKSCLKIKQVPEGDWSCFKCLERLTNQRQTRSRIKKMSKFI